MKRKIDVKKFLKDLWYYGKWLLIGVFIGFAFGYIFL